jgi:hypothetical protein
MTWAEAAATLQLLAEERVGTTRRQALLTAKAQEDRAAGALRDAAKG